MTDKTKDTEKDDMTGEFSRLIAVEGIIPDKTREENIEATSAECAALSARFGLKELEYFRARLSIRRVAGGDMVRLEGHIEAEVTQTCVVSLQNVHSHIETDFETFFSEDGKTDDEIDFTLEGAENTPEPLVNGMIDLGEVAAQYLSLELDPYPRAPGVSLAAQMSETGAVVRNSPFAVLQGALDENKDAKNDTDGGKKKKKTK